MVNNTIVSRFSGPLPLSPGASREIKAGPIYPAEEVLELRSNSGSQTIKAWTDKCVKDMQKWELDAEDLDEMLGLALRHGRFLGSEWCVQKPDGPWAACDAYLLVRSEWITYARKEIDIAYYIKFAIAKTGNLLLVASCHPSEDKG